MKSMLFRVPPNQTDRSRNDIGSILNISSCPLDIQENASRDWFVLLPHFGTEIAR